MRAVLLAIVMLWPTAQTVRASQEEPGPGATPPELEITLVGNAGVQLTDGTTSLMVDLPYESGAFGYQAYRPDEMAPPGEVVSVITHHHDDHFDPELFVAREGWRIIGPPSVTTTLPAGRVISGDSLRVGAFHVVAVPTPHTDDHRSYRIRWRGRVLFFTGDTEDPAALDPGPRPDFLFITPWLSCAAESSGTRLGSVSVAYHLRARGGDRVCGDVRTYEQGMVITASPIGRDDGGG